MLRTLIVEDDAEKRQRIAEVLLSIPGFRVDWISQEADAVSARRRLEGEVVDLLILDVAIPDRIDRDPKVDGGIRLLEEICNRARYHVPPHIVGVTAHQELLAGAEESFGSRLMFVLHYDQSSVVWSDRLRSGVQHLLERGQLHSVRMQSFASRLVILCALDSPELAGILGLPWEWSKYEIGGDEHTYWRGRFVWDDEEQIVFAAAASRKGMPAAGVLATKMIYSFNPEYIAMAVITAGISGRVSYGDVLAVEICWDWGSGKWVEVDGETQFLPAPYQSGPPASIVSRLRMLGQDVESLARIRHEWHGLKPDHPLSMKLGPVGSGAAVVADARFRDRILLQHREMIGIEMECYSLFLAASEASEPRPKAFALKSVVDFADSEKDDRYHDYAAYTSAHVLRLFVERYLRA